MALRKSRVFRVTGYGLAGLAVFSGVAHIAQKALSDGWNDSYHSAKLIRWTYGSALIVISAVALVGLVALILILRRRWRADSPRTIETDRRELRP
jgi:hypothetical protein